MIYFTKIKKSHKTGLEVTTMIKIKDLKTLLRKRSNSKLFLNINNKGIFLLLRFLEPDHLTIVNSELSILMKNLIN